ncbi:non-specific lipid transfer protein GPI-anchored 20-like isoform X2 [Syzygium oleosum]|uniref:non-specific lipid transfer protein GPI-anchored 20-like isoform X2 n=1 Tax=Syzygium oleosum TaxID=219896 RepID=UPI0024B9384D|nr:non-specific lipid transfer protein GPI-anchored 20-like isoform X2 [Syzygium oleosum]
MKHFRPLSLSLLLLAVAIALSITTIPVRSQITTPCTPSMISSFTPCLNFVTNSSLNSTSPTSQCCDSLKSLTSNGMGCMCLIVAGGIPFQMPINRTLAISLPRACNMPGVPLQCKATGAPLPAPGPATLGPILSPSSSPASSPLGSTDPQPDSPALAPESETPPLMAPPSPTVTSVNPTPNTGSRSNVNPSAAGPSNVFSPALLLVGLASAFLKYC